MPAATTAAHVVHLCAALAQRHAPAKQRRKQPKPVRSAPHVAPAWMIAQVGIGLIATVRMVIAQKVIAPTKIALVVTDHPVHLGHPALALINAATTVLVSVMTTVAVKVAVHKAVRAKTVATLAAKIAQDLIAHQHNRQSAAMTTARCVCPS